MHHALLTWSCLLTYLTVAVVQGSMCGALSSLPSSSFVRSKGSVVHGDGFWARLVLRGACCSVEALRWVDSGILGASRAGQGRGVMDSVVDGALLWRVVLLV